MANTSTLVKPAYLSYPERAGSFGDECIDFSELCGLSLYPEQKLAVDMILSHDAKGQLVASEVAVIEARQNGKTTNVLRPVALWDLFCGPDPDMIIWTAHRYKTTHEAFIDIRTLIDGTYELRRRVKKILEGFGGEEIELINGARMEFLARSKSGGRGLGGKRPILDEAFALRADQIGALLPTTLARPNAQIMYGSSAGLQESEPLREIRDRGRVGGDPSLGYVEWCARGSWAKPGCEFTNCNHHRNTPGCALDDEERWQEANPSLDRKIKRPSIVTMRRSLPAHEFGREVLGWWDDPSDDATSPIDVDEWDLCADVESTIDVNKGVAISVDVARYGAAAAISLAGQRYDGRHHVETIEYRPGTDWVVPRVVSLLSTWSFRTIERNKLEYKAVVLDPGGSAGALLPDFAAVKVFPILVSAREMGAACGDLAEAVLSGPTAPPHGFVHTGQPEVRIALEGAVRRDIGDGAWSFARRKSAEQQVDISPIVSFALARWALTVAKVPSAGPSIYIL